MIFDHQPSTFRHDQAHFVVDMRSFYDPGCGPLKRHDGRHNEIIRRMVQLGLLGPAEHWRRENLRHFCWALTIKIWGISNMIINILMVKSPILWGYILI
jgi:hypothetical protein